MFKRKYNTFYLSFIDLQGKTQVVSFKGNREQFEAFKERVVGNNGDKYARYE